MDTSYGPNFLNTRHRRKAAHATQAKELGVYRTNMFFHRLTRPDGITRLDCRDDATMRTQRNTGTLGRLKTFVSAWRNNFHHSRADLQQRPIVSGFRKRRMKSGIRRTRYPFFPQFAFLLLKDGFQAEQILAICTLRRQSCDRRFDKQTKLENILKREMMQCICKIFRRSSGNETAGAVAAHN